MRIRTIVSAVLAVLVLALALGCGRLKKNEYKLVRWPDGENDRYAIEIPRSKGSDVVIPAVRALQTANQFVSGKAYWKHLDGFYSTPSGLLTTNEFGSYWTSVKPIQSATPPFPPTRSLIAWCISHSVPTNIVEIKEFVGSRSPSGGGETLVTSVVPPAVRRKSPRFQRVQTLSPRRQAGWNQSHPRPRHSPAVRSLGCQTPRQRSAPRTLVNHRPWRDSSTLSPVSLLLPERHRRGIFPLRRGVGQRRLL